VKNEAYRSGQVCATKYQQRELDVATPQIGSVEDSIDKLDQWAWNQGMQFVWHTEEEKWTLDLMSKEELAAYKAAQGEE